MTNLRRAAAAFLALAVVLGPAAACGGDDEGEDQIGDEEIIDEGD